MEDLGIGFYYGCFNSVGVNGIVIKMKKEFNLSDFIRGESKYSEGNIRVARIKEGIKIFKRRLNSLKKRGKDEWNLALCWILEEEIDKLAGEKLK